MSRSYLSPNSVKPPLVTGACGLQTWHRDGNLFYFVKVQTQRKEYQIFWWVSNVFRLTNYIGNCCQFPTLPTFLTWVHLRKCLSGVWRMSDGLLCNVWSVFGRCLGNVCFFCFFCGDGGILSFYITLLSMTSKAWNLSSVHQLPKSDSSRST